MDYSRLFMNDFMTLYPTSPQPCAHQNCKNYSARLQNGYMFSDYCGNHKPKCQHCGRNTLWRENVCEFCDKK